MLFLYLCYLYLLSFCFSSHCVVYCVDEVTGGLEISHQVVLSSKDFPGAPGAVSCLRWSPDGCALAVAWSGGGISLWSTFGSLLMCSLAWDHGLNAPMSRLKVHSMVRLKYNYYCKNKNLYHVKKK